ncbi:MAG: hypothetical protein RLZZ447_91, partial [Verrucomicrobiota bacterium]
MPEKIPERAAALLAFPGEVPLPERVAACQEFLRREQAGLRARHAAGGGGRQICRERSWMMDALL